MQIEELEKLIDKVQSQQCETQTIEVKSAHQGYPVKLYDTLSSFSNQDDGGVIIFGLDENQGCKIVGVYDPQDLQHRIAEQCKQMQPIIRPLFTVCDTNSKTVVAAEIPGVDVAERPVYYKGAGRIKGSYIRVGTADEPMSDYEIYSFDAYRYRVRDDIRIADMADISHLDIELLNQYILSIKKNKSNIAKFTDNEILRLMGIIKDDKPTLAGVLCFSKYPQATFPQLCITAVVIPGTQMGDTGKDGERFLANKRIEGTIKEMLDEAILFVERNIREKTIIDAEGHRSDKTEYPITAVREAVINSLMHRDYSIHTEGTPVRILIFSDRMEIWNEGGLYGRLTIDSLGKVHADTRNQTLVNILEIQKVAENRYSGIPTIRAEMELYRLPEPIFENRRGSFVVTLRNDMSTRVPNENASVTRISVIDIAAFCKIPRTREEIASFIGKTQYYAIKTYVVPLLESGTLKMTIPDKPRSRNQRYYSQ